MDTLVNLRLPADSAPARERFAQLLQQHQGIVVKVARGYCHEPEDRGDLIQEISTHAWGAFSGFDPAKAQFSTWLYRIALNVAISQLRSRRIRGRHHGHAEQSDEPLARDTLDDDLGLQQLQRLIGSLPPLDRALMLLYLDDCSHRQIGQVLGISPSNVATRLHRLRQQLRQQLNPPAIR